MPSRERKQQYFATMKGLIEKYPNVMIVHADHVGSFQFQQIRIALRGTAEVLMGKNTMMRRCINDFLAENPGHKIESILPHVAGNIGFIFTAGDLGQVRQVIDDNRVPAAARAGVVAESDVIVSPGPTGCDPGQTSWFQALNVPTKISRGQIEIVSELKLISKGEKVGSSEAALLQKLNIKPFTYGLVLRSIYTPDGVFDAAVLDLSDDDLMGKFLSVVRTLAALSMSAGVPSLASLPHMVGNTVKTLIGLAAMAGYSFKEMEEWDKLFNMDPEELAAMAAASAAASGGAAGGEGGEAAAKKEEVEEEEVDMGGGADLFGGDDGY